MSIPSAFEGVVMKLLAKDPKNRFQTAEDVVADAGTGWQVQRRFGLILIWCFTRLVQLGITPVGHRPYQTRNWLSQGAWS